MGDNIAEVYLIDLGQSEQNLVTRFIQRDQPGVRVLAARTKPLFAQMVERLKIFLRWFTGINAVRVRRIRLRSAHRTYR